MPGHEIPGGWHSDETFRLYVGTLWCLPESTNTVESSWLDRVATRYRRWNEGQQLESIYGTNTSVQEQPRTPAKGIHSSHAMKGMGLQPSFLSTQRHALPSPPDTGSGMTRRWAVLAVHSDTLKTQNPPRSIWHCSGRLFQCSQNIYGGETALHLAKDVERSARLHRRLRHICAS